MSATERETAEQAAPPALDRGALCASVLVGRVAFVVELPSFGKVVVGRDADADLQIGDASVSRRHAALDLRGEGGVVIDSGSRNGTLVNGERVAEGERALARGDEIAFGSARMALLARSMVPAGVRPVLLRSALLRRLDTELARGGDVEAHALRMPGRWYETDGVARWLGALPDDAYAGMLSEKALLLVGANLPLAGLRPELLDIQVGVARSADSGASSGLELVNAALRAIGATRAPARVDSRVVAVNAAMLSLYDEAAKVAASAVSVLIVGETGSGKEVLARFIHERSGRRGALVGVNTAALPDALVESELFGHERGAFSGAHQAKIGLIEAASGGTLFLDEIGDLPPSLQAKLLRVLEERSVRRVGATSERKVDVRIVAATHRDLDRAVGEGAFRRDLLFRLNACTLHIPPLRQRLDEIEPLSRELLAASQTSRSPQSSRSPPLALAPSTLEILRRHDWPGNVRELRNVLERGAAMAQAGGVLLPEHLPPYLRAAREVDAPQPPDVRGPDDMREGVKEYERRRIIDALAKTGGNQSQAAKLLGLPRRTLAYRMARLGIVSSE